MKGGLERFARRLWSGELGAAGEVMVVLLAPLSGLWRAVTWWRNWRLDRTGPTAVEGLTVISIGNLAVGGAGKTPLASLVALHLAAEGQRPAILLSGFGPDELLLHARWTPDLPVLAAQDRVGLAQAVAAGGADAAVLDDGFQHRRLARHLDIVLLAVEDGFPGRVLPRGPYRETPGALARADAIVLTRRTASVEEARELEERVHRVPGLLDSAVVACVHFSPGLLRTLAEWTARATGATEVGLVDPVAVTAIARPEAFREAVRSVSTGSVELVSFPDHHELDAETLHDCRRRFGSRPIVLTEKDAVKLGAEPGTGSEPLPWTWVLEQKISWDWGEDTFLGILDGAFPGEAAIDQPAPSLARGEARA